MSKLNMKEWINEIIQKKEVVAMPIYMERYVCGITFRCYFAVPDLESVFQAQHIFHLSL